jgi:hypothetical protein
MAATVLFAAPPALADFFSLELDGQAGWTQLTKIEHPGTPNLVTLDGFTAGVHGELEILFLSAVVDYQHFFRNADLLHLGLGADFKLPLAVIEPYVRGSIGIMMLYASKSAFDPDAESDFEPTAGFQLRVGVGLDIPLGDWFAIGVATDIGMHYITQEAGYNLSVMGYLGLRI